MIIEELKRFIWSMDVFFLYSRSKALYIRDANKIEPWKVELSHSLKTSNIIIDSEFKLLGHILEQSNNRKRLALRKKIRAYKEKLL